MGIIGVLKKESMTRVNRKNQQIARYRRAMTLCTKGVELGSLGLGVRPVIYSITPPANTASRRRLDDSPRKVKKISQIAHILLDSESEHLE